MARHKDTESMLTIDDVARLLNVHINTVRRWSNQGIIKTYRISSRGDRRFQREDIDSFLLQKSRIADGGQERWPGRERRSGRERRLGRERRSGQ